VPGLAALNDFGDARVLSISCAASGDCAAGGYSLDSASHYDAFVVSETNGSWGEAIRVAATATLTSGQPGDPLSISCAAVGDCGAGGYVTVGYGRRHPFVVSETNGSWGKAIHLRNFRTS
jgi:hypothetical protein